MRRLLAVILIIAGSAGSAFAASSAPGSVAATPNVGPIAGATMRGDIWTGAIAQAHLWRFRPDGRLTGTYTITPMGSQAVSSFLEFNDDGKWEYANGRLCVQWRQFFAGRQQCYTLTPVKPGWVRFENTASGPSFDAQFSR